MACIEGHVDIVKYLVSANCDIEAEDDVRYVRLRNYNYFYYIVGTMQTDSYCLYYRTYGYSKIFSVHKLRH